MIDCLQKSKWWEEGEKEGEKAWKCQIALEEIEFAAKEKDHDIS